MPRSVVRCASRLARGAVELILRLRPNETRESRSPSQLRGDSCSGPCGRRVPRGEDNGVVILEQACSFVSAQYCEFASPNPFYGGPNREATVFLARIQSRIFDGLILSRAGKFLH